MHAYEYAATQHGARRSALGAQRAHSVALFLTQLGVDGQRIAGTSRGELDAIGTDESTWQLDRRVDVVLNGE